MQLRSVFLPPLALCLVLAALPAVAQQQVIYDNGPVNGQVYARNINPGFVVTNSYTYQDTLLAFSGLSFWVWLVPGDTLTSVDVSFGTTPFGSDLYHATVNPGPVGNCFTNRFGYNVCQVTLQFSMNNFSAGWLTLQNAAVLGGDDPVYWDQNSGVGCMSQGCPSKASQKGSVPSATIPSETFTIYGVQIERHP